MQAKHHHNGFHLDHVFCLVILIITTLFLSNISATMTPTDFHLLDTNNDRVITENELRAWFSSRYPPHLVEAIVHDIIQKDFDQNGTLSLGETTSLPPMRVQNAINANQKPAHDEELPDTVSSHRNHPHPHRLGNHDFLTNPRNQEEFGDVGIEVLHGPQGNQQMKPLYFPSGGFSNIGRPGQAGGHLRRHRNWALPYPHRGHPRWATNPPSGRSAIFRGRPMRVDR